MDRVRWEGPTGTDAFPPDHNKHDIWLVQELDRWVEGFVDDDQVAAFLQEATRGQRFVLEALLRNGVNIEAEDRDGR